MNVKKELYQNSLKQTIKSIQLKKTFQVVGIKMLRTFMEIFNQIILKFVEWSHPCARLVV